MSYKATGNPISEIAYGQALQKIDAREKVINADPKEVEVMALWKKSADDLDADIKGLPGSLDAKKADLNAKIAAATDPAEKDKLDKALKALPATPEIAQG